MPPHGLVMATRHFGKSKTIPDSFPLSLCKSVPDKFVSQDQPYDDYFHAVETSVRAWSKLALALIGQTARDLIAQTEIVEGMSKWQIAAREENRKNRDMALHWVKDCANGSHFSLAECCVFINIVLGDSHLQIPENALRHVLLTHPERIVSMTSDDAELPLSAFGNVMPFGKKRSDTRKIKGVAI